MEENRAELRVSPLPDEAEYPRDLTEQYELLECFSEKENTRTLLAVSRDTRKKCVVKCYLRENSLYGYLEPESLRQLSAGPMPRFIAEYRNDLMRCVLWEYIPGDTLFTLAKRRTYSEKEVLNIGLQLCDQLQALHTLQPPVIHRDIKPQNIVIRPDGTAVLIDFGIARVQTDKETDTVAFGTQGFAAPEQYGFSQTDARSDIYSLGILMYWLLHHETKLSGRHDSPLEKVIAHCASFDPERRYSDIGQVKRALLAARPAARRKRSLLLSAAAVLLLMMTALGISLVSKSHREVVIFTQPLIEQAVRAALDLDETRPVTKDLLGRVTGIYIVADGAYPNADQFYSAISRWYAAGSQPRGPVSSLDDLALLPNLEQVCIVAQELEDISALSEIRTLNKVEFKHNYISDISPLAGMKRLTSVGINDNPVRDISPLTECPNLAFLDLCDVRSYEASVIARLGNFDFLDISNPTESYRFLDGKSILDLRVAWTGLDDLHVLDQVTRLERLEIDHTAVSDLSPLALHKGLKVLKLEGLPVTDFSVLLELPQLEEVYVSKEQTEAIKALEDISFSVHYE